jgi:outer membrane immunogenic protein
MKRVLIAVALGLACFGSALAADLPAPPEAPAAVYAPPPPAVYNWGGLYFGVNGGWGFGNSSWSDADNVSGLGTTGNFNTNGYAAGGTIGVNWQSDAFVFGLEGDLDAMGLDGKSSSLYCGGPVAPGNLGLGANAKCETKQTWLGTFRGRVGYAADRVLFYGTAGGAVGNIETGVNNSFVSQTKAGWTVGAGVEAAFADNWTARVEYLFVDMQNASCNTAAACGNDFVVGVGAFPANQTVRLNSNLIRLGLDYKFR